MIYFKKVYPNPATNTATVSVSNVSEDLKIILTDLSGKVLWHSEKIIDRNSNIPVTNLANGTYIIIVKDEEHNKTLKLVKRIIQVFINLTGYFYTLLNINLKGSEGLTKMLLLRLRI